jgi:NDP-4-keto-2,6-dideoxyhexose 3-C-methyltransferase
LSDSFDSRVITRCRVCGSKELASILSLGSIYVSDFVTDRASGTEKTYPLELVLCDPTQGGCGLLQLRHTVNPEKMYGFYYYHSGTNAMMRKALLDVAISAEKRTDLKKGDMALDIGCNDGTLLRSYRKKGIKLVGFDPAKNLMPEARVRTTKIINDYFNYEAFEENFMGKKAKIITCIAMFYDLDDPNKFVADITKCLDMNGLWIIQMSYLPLMLEKNAFDNICHEHLEYYSLFSLQNLLKRHGLKVVDVELNDVNAGSFRVYIRHQDSAGSAQGMRRVCQLEKSEEALKLAETETYFRFASRVDKVREEVYKFIKKNVQKGKVVYVYGASTKGNTLLQYFDLDHHLIKAAAERNPDKFGKKTVGTLIPIVSEDEARAAKPDYFLVLPWHFLDIFLRQEKKYLSSGGHFIVPLPRMTIIPPMRRSGRR